MNKFFHYRWATLLESTRIARNSLDIHTISPILVELLIVAEDHRYNSHPGVDPIALCRAVWRSLICGRREGGSTIAMQLVRVLTGRHEKTISRKFFEIYLAVKLTNFLSNSELPRIYLAVAYYGWRMNGLDQALKRLNFQSPSISHNEAANLIARLKYPESRQCSVLRKSQISGRVIYILHKAEKLSGREKNHRKVKANAAI